MWLLVNLTIDPAALVFLSLLLLFVWRFWRQKSVDKGLLALLVLSWCFGAITLVAPLTHQWEKRANVYRCEQTPSTWVLLGGGVSRTGLSEPFPLAKLSAYSQRRLQQAWKALEQQPDTMPLPALWLSGYEAPLMLSVLEAPARERGVRLNIDRQSRTTWQTAEFFAKQQAQQPQSQPIAVVTSHLHTPRAMLAFERLGVKACALPVDKQGAPVARFVFVPQSSVLGKTRRLMHELIGMLYYSLRREG